MIFFSKKNLKKQAIPISLTLLIVLWFATVNIAVSTTESGQEVHTQEAYVLGIFPFIRPTKLQQVFSPIAVMLEEAIGRPIKLRSAASFEQFRNRLADERYDIVYLQPFDYVDIAEPRGYMPLAARNEDLTSITVVREDSTYESLHDLKGVAIVMPPPLAAVSQLFFLNMENMAIDSKSYFNIHEVVHHDDCLHLLNINNIEACITAIPPLRHYESRSGKGFRIIHQTDPIPHVLFAVHPRLSELEYARLREQILSLSFAEIGSPDVFKTANHEALFRPVNDTDYDVIRNLKSTGGVTAP